MDAGAILKPFRHPRAWCALWALAIALVVVGSLLPGPDLPHVPDGGDKVEHIAGYCVLAAFAVQLFARRAWLAGACVALVLLGIALEIAQGVFTTTRTMDPADALADAVGVLLGAATVLLPWRDALLRLDRQRVDAVR